MGVVTHKILCTWQLLGLALKRAMAGTKWANFCPGCMNRPRKCYSHLLVHFWQERTAWALSRYLPTVKADYCMLVNEWA